MHLRQVRDGYSFQLRLPFRFLSRNNLPNNGKIGFDRLQIGFNLLDKIGCFKTDGMSFQGANISSISHVCGDVEASICFHPI